MFLGIRAKSKKFVLVEVDYTIHIQEIKPWPPSQSLKSLKSSVLHWNNGENSGFTKSVVPSIEDGIIEFNESFNLHVIMAKDPQVKGNITNIFHKNVLELNLYESRSKTPKGNLIGSALIDLSEHGVIKESLDMSMPFNCKKASKSNSQPVLFIKIEPFDKENSVFSSQEASMNKDGKGSVSNLMNEEYAEEAEIASLTDDEDDDLSHSSLDISAPVSKANFSSPQGGPNAPMHHKISSDVIDKRSAISNTDHAPESTKKDQSIETCTTDAFQSGSSSLSSSVDFYERIIYEEGECPPSESLENTQSVHSSLSSFISNGSDENFGLTANPSLNSNSVRLHEKLVDHKIGGQKDFHHIAEMEDAQSDIVLRTSSPDSRYGSEDKIGHVKKQSDANVVNRPHKSLRSALRKPIISNAFAQRLFGKGSINVASDGHENVKSVKLATNKIDGSVCVSDEGSPLSKDNKIYEQMHKFSERAKRTTSNKIQELELRIAMLKEELVEAAAIEIGLHSAVAEHGSSYHKLYTPARRLSRLYLHASKNWSSERKASSARSVISGLILVVKACGNDVPRLTFWLSNAVVLRTIIALSVGDSTQPASNGSYDKRSGIVGRDENASPKSKSNKGEQLFSFIEDFDNWEDPNTLLHALQKIEAWMFSRITESVWWQTLTPRMQSANDSEQLQMNQHNSKKGYGKNTKPSNQKQADMSINLWEKAFKEVCARLCPNRALGHDCGCLPVLARLVMEQCVAKLDVAMFNAILRESDDDIPTNPISDPISDPKVLPVPVGKTSFGAGAQLKNVIGSWSRQLSDLFGIKESLEDKKNDDDDRQAVSSSSKPFQLLNALSDLLMLPKDMLLETSIRKELCPMFSGLMIKQILSRFVTDEFCPDPIPQAVLQALDYEDHEEESATGVIREIPCNASPITYSPPPVASVVSFVGDAERQTLLKRTGSSIIRKCCTSDDELDEVESPFHKVVLEGSSSTKSKEKDPNVVVRYQLLREVWSNELMLDM